MAKQFILYSILVALSLACKKDKGIEKTPADPAIYNTLIAGGSTTSFQRKVGGEYMDAFESCRQLNDGGYIFCGFTENDHASQRDIYLLRTNEYGATLWTKRFSDNFTDQGFTVEPTNDNGFIIAAKTYADPSSLSCSFPQLIKTDSLGVQTWKKGYSGCGFFKSVRQTNDGGYIAGGTLSDSLGTAILLKTDAFGNEVWRKTYGSRVNFNGLDKTADGGFIFCTTRWQPIAGESDISLIRTDSDGDTLWTRIYSMSGREIAQGVKETPAGNFIVCGFGVDSSNVNPLVKLVDANGSELWTKDYPGTIITHIHYISNTSDGNFIAAGDCASSASAIPYQWFPCLIKIDVNGNIIWLKNSFNHLDLAGFSELHETSDNGFIIAGAVDDGDALIVKTDANGN
jgi:hypothetical protein